MPKVIKSVIAIVKHSLLKKHKDIESNLPESFTYTAHTGCVGTKENSLESIECGVLNGADIVEFDLNFTSEGEPVLSHDEPKGREITLDEAFRKISEYKSLKVNVDVKSTVALGKVKALAEKHHILDRIFYTGIGEDFVEAVQRDTPNIPYYLNVGVEKNQSEEYLYSLVKKVKDCGAVGINFNKDNATKKLVDVFHGNGLLVSIWTVSNTADIYRILSYSPDNITTRRPDKIKKILSKKKTDKI
ncbi:MAG: glycerophosphodiester phosphodiesterase [Clostridia bacterium]|nr:glycerophosphodiester phosphodiesterase [Clostridia bacterium]